MVTTAVLINGDHPGSAFIFNRSQAAVSPSGTWRAVVQPRADTGFDRIYTSSDFGQSWTSLVDAPWVDGSVAISDSGDVHYCAYNGTNMVYYTYTGSWSAGSNIWNQNTQPFLLIDGTDLIAYLDLGSAAIPWKSTNGGTTWASGTGGPTFVKAVAWIGGYVHVLYGGPLAYDRYDVAGNAWQSWPSGSALTGLNAQSYLLANASTSDLYIVAHYLSAGVWKTDIHHSTDSGGTWSSVVAGETVTGGPGSDSRMLGAVSMGSDSLLHYYGSDGTDFFTVSRDLAGSGTYGTVDTVGPLPAGSAPYPTAFGSSRSFPPQRHDGMQDNVNEMYTQIEAVSGAPSVTELMALIGVIPASGWTVGMLPIG